MPGETGVKRYGTICTIALLAALACFSPGLLSLGWYVSHKHEVSYKGKTITIPIGWRLEADERAKQDDITLTKGPTVLFGTHYYQAATFSGLPAAWEPPSTVYEKWKGFVAATYTPDAYFAVKEQQTGVGQQQFFCASARFRKNPIGEHVDCILLPEGIRAEFNGTSSDVDTFFDVLRKIQ